MGSEIHFPEHTVETAPAAARPILEGAASRLGFLPVAMARQAEAPIVGSTFAHLMRVWAETSFSPLEREVVTFAIAHETGCELCLAMHSMIVERMDQPELLSGLRAAEPLADPKLEALRRFTLAALRRHGGVSDDELEAFLEVGYSRRHALELMVGVATYVLSTYANRLVRAPVDAPLARFAV